MDSDKDLPEQGSGGRPMNLNRLPSQIKAYLKEGGSRLDVSAVSGHPSHIGGQRQG